MKISLKTYLNLGQLYLSSKLLSDRIAPNTIYFFRSSIRLTENCNARCVTCNSWKKHKKDRISTEGAVNLIRELREIGVERIRFTGGEPFLRRDLFEVLESFSKDMFKKVTVATNGLLLGKYADSVNNSIITDLGVSIDGLKATNDAMRGVEGYFDIAFKGMRNINKRITVMTTLTQRNAQELQELFDICEDNGLLWDFNLLDNHLFFFAGVDVDSVWPDEKTVDFIGELIRKNWHRPVLSRISELQLQYAEKYLKRLPVNEPPCSLGYTDIDIDSEGNFFTGCYVLPPIGNIIELNLKDLVKSDIFKKRLKQMRKRQCPGCSCGYELNVSIENLPKMGFEYIAKRRKK